MSFFFKYLGVCGVVLLEITGFLKIRRIIGEKLKGDNEELRETPGIFSTSVHSHPVEGPVLNGFRHMVGQNGFLPGHIGDGTGDF